MPADEEPQPSTSSMDQQDLAWLEGMALRYQQRALNKSRLKYCIYFHYFLSSIMFAKLTPYILDACDWLVTIVEELEVPEPDAWEGFWMSSILATIFCWDAIKKNSATTMTYYIIGIVLLGYIPLLYASVLWFDEAWIYLFSNSEFEMIALICWKDYPYGVLWYGFLLLALLVHSFSMFFSFKLMSSWKAGCPGYTD